MVNPMPWQYVDLYIHVVRARGTVFDLALRTAWKLDRHCISEYL